MEIKEIFEKTNFADRYRLLCDKHVDFENRMRGSKKNLYENMLRNFDYQYKYYSNGSFFQIKEKFEPLLFQLHLILKDGQVESLFYSKINDIDIENLGRLDFIPQKLNITFERKETNLPLYTSEEELKEILTGLFSIYEDLKKEFVKQLEN